MKRVQMRRGWKLPPRTKMVARPTKWGNPWKVGEVVGSDIDSRHFGGALVDHRLAADLYRAAFYAPALIPGRPARMAGLAVNADDARRELAGFDLACYCRLCIKHQGGLPFDETCHDCQPCHADILGRVAA